MKQQVSSMNSDANVKFDGLESARGYHLKWSPDSDNLVLFSSQALKSFFRRNKSQLIFSSLIFGSLALSYGFIAKPYYTAQSQLLLESPLARSGIDESGMQASIDTAQVDTQLEILKSRKVAADVIQSLGLEELLASRSDDSILLKVKSIFSDSNPEDSKNNSDARMQDSISRLQNMIFVRRVARTYVFDLFVTADNAKLSADIANSLAQSFIKEQLSARFNASRTTADWMQERLSELRKRAVEADTKAQEFRASHGLILADGKLVNEQQTAELSSQVTSARSDLAKAEARFARIQEIISTHDSNAAVSESIDNPIIGKLRGQYLDASKKEVELTKKLGANHSVVADLRNSMKQYDRLIFDELERIAQSYRSDLSIARARVKSADQDLQFATKGNIKDNADLVTLRELERESDTVRALYQSFLQQYNENVQKQSFPITDARIITKASVPTKPSFPKKTILALGGIAFGLAFSAVFGLGRDIADRTVRTARQLRNATQLETLGYIPILSFPDPEKEHEQSDSHASFARMSRFVRYHPLSSTAEAFRLAKSSIDLASFDRSKKVVGIISALPGEGKSLIASNLANVLALSGHSTMLIDADLRNPQITKSYRHSPSNLISRANTSKFNDPAFVTLTESDTSESVECIINTSGLQDRLCTALRSDFEYAIVDLPPLGPVADTRSLISLIDHFILVVEWGVTPISLIASTLEQERQINSRVIGVLLNKIDPEKIRLYEDESWKGFHSALYKRYYNESPQRDF